MGRASTVVKAQDEVVGIDVKNNTGDTLGKIEEVMLDKISGQVAYVALDCGSFLGIGGKLFALPWNALHYDAANHCFIANIKERLQNATGFDKDHWPAQADTALAA